MKEEKVVLVTGCNGGIGRAICDLFSQNNWTVVGVDVKEKDFELANFIYLQGDISKTEGILEIEDFFKSSNRSLHCLVNNAAIQICKPFFEMEEGEWDDIMGVNLKAPFQLIQKFYAYLKNTQGSVVNISSVHAVATSQNIAVYATSKGGLVALTRALAIECANDSVRINAVLPGAVDTGMLRDGLKRGHVEGSTEEDLIKGLGLKHVIGRVGEPEEIAKTVLFLGDNEQSSFITGQSLVVDGGATIKLSTE